ncbi:MAG TPA: hypothetical protein VFL62_23465, partial [Bradyrhizobium sp.]|uniref:hypothetical protein n=1 Tax=Bradyrhizobium sp. TaxID=376 RepID=UPI002D7E77CF
VRGPSFYDLGEAIACQTIFTISGMAAIAALVFAVARLVEQASLVIPSGCYGETKELVEGYARHLRLISAAQDPAGATARAASPRMLLLDSSAPAFDFNLSRDAMSSALDLIIFDTTCLSAGSRRIRRVLDLARRCKVPVAMVRSHTKLDSLGAEYGRLGSVTFVDWDKQGARSKLKELPPATTDAVRLIGGAAIPAHFPPYVGTRAYRRLTNRRMAAILRNCRRASRYCAASLSGLTAELHFTHNLYITLKSARPLDEAAARAISTRIVDDLAQSGLPIRHAGSFGFDFAASEWFCDSTTGQYHVRIAVPDLATPHWDELTRAIAGWWQAHQRETAGA